MRLGFRVVGCQVEWQNPRVQRWEPISSFGSESVAREAAKFYASHDYEGWESVKLSKSHRS